MNIFKMPWAIYVLGAGIFVVNTSEFVIMGLLEVMAQDLGISLSQAGFLVTAYAVGVVIGAPFLTPFVINWPKKRLLGILMLVFAAGNAACAIAPNYQVLMIARVVTALAQATFFGLGAVVAMQLVEPNKQASAISAVFFGSTVANMLGAPLGTALGQAFGWRSTFVVLTVIAALTMLLIMVAIPKIGSGDKPDLRKEFFALTRAPVLKSLLITVLSFGGTFTTFTFIAPILTQQTGFSPSVIPALLLLFGFGMMVGNPIGGRLADKNLHRSVVYSVLFLTAVLVAMGFATESKALMLVLVFLFGVALFATIAPLQMQVMSKAGDAPVLSSAFNIAAFNLGNALGAWLSSMAVGQGVSLSYLPFIGSVVCLLGLFLTLTSKSSVAQKVVV